MSSPSRSPLPPPSPPSMNIVLTLTFQSWCLLCICHIAWPGHPIHHYASSASTEKTVTVASNTRFWLLTRFPLTRSLTVQASRLLCQEVSLILVLFFHMQFPFFSMLLFRFSLPTLVFNIDMHWYILFLSSLGVNAVLGSVGLQFSKKKKNSGKSLAFSKNKERNKPVISKIFLHPLLWNLNCVSAHVVLTL